MPNGPEMLPLSSPVAGLVFTTLLRSGPLSRAEVSRRSGLSAAAVTKAIQPLLSDGYLTELGYPADRGRGRPATLVDVRADRCSFLGVKLTDEELIGVLADLKANAQVTRRRALSSVKVADVLAELADLVADLLAQCPAGRPEPRHLGLAVSGDVDRSTGLVRYSPFLSWRNVPLTQLAETATGLMTVIENDVKSLTVAEQWFGAGAGTTSFALVTVGKGIGCGLVVNDAVVAGSHGVAGEIGHLTVDVNGPPCRCGSRGCIEAIASDPAIAARVAEATGMPAADGIALARAGNRAARDVYEQAGRAIGAAIGSMANLIGPERIVISGEGLAAYGLFEHQMRAAFATQSFGATAQCEIIVRPLSFEEWARGAAAVAIATFVAPDKPLLSCIIPGKVKPLP